VRRARRPAVVAAGLAVAVALAGCESTQDKSAAIGRRAKQVTREKGLRIGARNTAVVVGRRVVVQDRNGVAAVVELRNTDARGQAGVPVALTVRDARGRSLYTNTAPGLAPALVSVPVLGRGQTVFWVNNQVTAAGRAASLDVRVGAAQGRAPARVPRIAVTGLTPGSDSDGAFAKAVVRNASQVAQRQLTVYCVARRGGRIVAAGSAFVPALPAGGRAPVTIFFIGDPAGATLEAAAPATVLR
jgi:hypothetical protein